MHVSSPSRRPLLALTAAAAAWGVAVVIAKTALSTLAPLTLFPVQLASGVVFTTSLLAVRREPPERSWQTVRIGLLGILNPGIAYTLGIVGLTYITASLSVVLWALEPLLILAFAWRITGEQAGRWMIGPALLSLAGVGLVLGPGGRAGTTVGVVLTVAGVAACALYTVLAKKLMVGQPTLPLLAVQQAFALVFAILLSLLWPVTGSGVTGVVPLSAWVGSAVSGILYYGVAYWLFLSGLRHTTATTAGMFVNLVPVFGLVSAYLVLSERFAPVQWLGSTLVVISVGVAVAGQTRREAVAS